MSPRTSFEVSVLILDTDGHIVSWLESFRAYLEKDEPLLGTSDEGHEPVLGTTLASVKFRLELAADEARLMRRVAELLQRPANVIVASDALAVPNGAAGFSATKLTADLRQYFFDRPDSLVGLLALVVAEPRRTPDIDWTVDERGLLPEQLKGSLLRVAFGLWLKSRFRSPEALGRGQGVRVELVRGRDELKECFALRHRVYSALGYLSEPVSVCDSQLEVDAYDALSLHLVAKDSEQSDPALSVLGTVRLVTEVLQHQKRSVVGGPPNIDATQSAWVRELAQQDAVLSAQLAQPKAMPFPIFENSDFGAKWPELLEGNKHAKGGEISRLMVSPRHRGLGISEMLLRAAIAVATGLKKEFLLLECVPAHVSMYARYGFVPLGDYHCRARDLDQQAIGMRLDLTGIPFTNAVLAKAQADLKLLIVSQLLCLCRDRNCWKQPGFKNRETDHCPLQVLHVQAARAYQGNASHRVVGC